MSFRNTVVTAAAASLLLAPLTMTAQDTTRRDTTRRDTTSRDTTKRTTTTTPTTPTRTQGTMGAGMRSSSSVMSTAPRSNMKTQRQLFSDQRVRVSKEYGTSMRPAPTPVPNADSIERARQDSVDRAMQHDRDSVAALDKARTDSIARIDKMRTDSIAAADAARLDAARRDSIARADSMTAQQQRISNRPHFNNSGWYIGVAGGGAMPSGDFESLGYKSGFDVNVPIGWHKPTNLLGFRVDLGYSQFDAQDFVGTGTGGTAVTLTNEKPKVLSATFDLTAKLPLVPSHKLNVYALGGAGLYHFRSFGSTSALSSFLGNDVIDNPDKPVEKVRNKVGAEAGGGLEYAVGSASIFVESRFINVWADRGESVAFNDFFGPNRSKSLHWVPVMLGVSIR